MPHSLRNLRHSQIFTFTTHRGNYVLRIIIGSTTYWENFAIRRVSCPPLVDAYLPSVEFSDPPLTENLRHSHWSLMNSRYSDSFKMHYLLRKSFHSQNFLVNTYWWKFDIRNVILSTTNYRIFAIRTTTIIRRVSASTTRWGRVPIRRDIVTSQCNLWKEEILIMTSPRATSLEFLGHDT